MYNLAIKKCTSPPLLAPRLKFSNENVLPHQGSNPGLAEPEADMLQALKMTFKASRVSLK